MVSRNRQRMVAVIVWIVVAMMVLTVIAAVIPALS